MARSFDVFVSYRRTTGAELAQLIRTDLQHRGCKVFVDLQALVGEFGPALLRHIEQTPNFVVVLTPGSLVQRRTDDWFCKEIAHAIDKQRNIIPVRCVDYPIPNKTDLPVPLRVLTDYHHLTYAAEFADATIDQIYRRLVRKGDDVHAIQKSSGGIKLARRRASVTLAMAVLLFLTLVCYSTLRPTRYGHQAQLGQLLHNHCWISYDPVQYDPFEDRYPTTLAIRADLRTIRAAGFTGIVTFSSRGTLARIPAIAREEGLATIMGVWNPLDLAELANARRQSPFVDAYCIGHNGLERDYTIAQLKQAIARLRKRTGLPVTTSAESRYYFENPELCSIGDWIFPDFHLDLHRGSTQAVQVDVTRDAAAYLDTITKLAAILRAHRDCPLMVKCLSYPCRGAEGASLETQEQFVGLVIRQSRDALKGPSARVSIAFHSAFDYDWKVANSLFDEWDAFSGIMETDGALRPAGEEIITQWYR